MAEYIDREALLQDIKKLDRVRNILSPVQHFLDVEVFSCINQSPAADVEEVKHGRWIEKIGRAMCSVCADECWSYSAMEYNYCPNCGAKMDGGKENEIE